MRDTDEPPLETSPSARKTDHTPRNAGGGLNGRTPPATGGFAGGVRITDDEVEMGCVGAYRQHHEHQLAARRVPEWMAEQSHSG
jgi:hypothetical protein